jgi:hypothetical protein
MFICIYRKSDFNVGSLFWKKPTSSMRKETEKSDGRVERRICKFYVQILLLLGKLLVEPLRDPRNPAAEKGLNTTSLTYSC